MASESNEWPWLYTYPCNEFYLIALQGMFATTRPSAQECLLALHCMLSGRKSGCFAIPRSYVVSDLGAVFPSLVCWYISNLCTQALGCAINLPHYGTSHARDVGWVHSLSKLYMKMRHLTTSMPNCTWHLFTSYDVYLSQLYQAPASPSHKLYASSRPLCRGTQTADTSQRAVMVSYMYNTVQYRTEPLCSVCRSTIRRTGHGCPRCQDSWRGTWA